MFVDNSLSFNGSWTTPQAITTTTTSTTVVDITGAGVGNAPAMINGFPNANTSMGEDWGLGDGMALPYVYLTVTTAGTTSNTLTVALNAAPDNGSYSAGSYTQIYQSKAFTGTALIKGSVLLFQVPTTLFEIGGPTGYSNNQALPRFYQLGYTCSGALTVSVAAGVIINPPSHMISTLYNSNFQAV